MSARQHAYAGGRMGFHRLVGDPQGEILLANLYEMVQAAVIPAPVIGESLRDMAERLRACDAGADPVELRTAACRTVYSDPESYHCQSVDAPGEDFALAAIVGFDKILKILKVISNRRTSDADLKAWVKLFRNGTPPPDTIAEAAGFINDLGERNRDITLSNVRTIFWAAPRDDIHRVISGTVADLGRWDGGAIATDLRNRLGLQQLRAFPSSYAKHLFLFRSHKLLSEIEYDRDLAVKRPSALDGIDNARFSQLLVARPRLAGCGLTIDLSHGRFGPGVPEVAMTPVPIEEFECRYLGELRGSPVGRHDRFLNTIAPGRSAVTMADALLGATVDPRYAAP